MSLHCNHSLLARAYTCRGGGREEGIQAYSSEENHDANVEEMRDSERET